MKEYAEQTDYSYWWFNPPAQLRAVNWLLIVLRELNLIRHNTVLTSTSQDKLAKLFANTFLEKP